MEVIIEQNIVVGRTVINMPSDVLNIVTAISNAQRIIVELSSSQINVIEARGNNAIEFIERFRNSYPTIAYSVPIIKTNNLKDEIWLIKKGRNAERSDFKKQLVHKFNRNVLIEKTIINKNYDENENSPMTISMKWFEKPQPNLLYIIEINPNARRNN